MNIALFLEIKNEYTEHLVDTITPYIYEGLSSIYKEAVRIAEENDSKDKTLLIFQKLLQTVNTWNQLRIDEETTRIKQLSNTADYLDDLVRAVIKSNIILLAYSNTISNLIGQSFYNSLTTSTFVHRCYTECAKYAHNNPYLFYHGAHAMDYKRNQIIIQEKIRDHIVKAIRKILPISMILKEYLINSINIIQEPTKVELLGMPPNPPENIANTANIARAAIPEILPNAPSAGNQKQLSEKKKIDPQLEKEVMKIIKSEGLKTDKQKLRAIMDIDKLLTSAEPTKAGEMSAKKIVSSITKKNISAMIPPHLIEVEDDDDAFNMNLGQSDKKLLHMNFDDEPTVRGSTNKKTLSGTSISVRPMPKNNNIQRMYDEISEKMDPTKVELIEDYGQFRRNSRQ